MKKVITLIVMVSLALTIQAQNITNTLGSSGNFVLNDNSGTQVMKVTHTSRLYLGPASGYAEAANLNIHKDSGPGGISITSYKGTPNPNKAVINFNATVGKFGDSPAMATDGESIGWLSYFGMDGTSWRNGASIKVHVEGTVATGHVPMSVKFDTDDGSSMATRMTIHSSGRVNIATVLNLTPGAAPSSPQAGDIYFDSSLNKARCYDGTTWQNLW